MLINFKTLEYHRHLDCSHFDVNLAVDLFSPLFDTFSLSYFLWERIGKGCETQWIVLVHGKNNNLYFCFVNAEFYRVV